MARESKLGHYGLPIPIHFSDALTVPHVTSLGTNPPIAIPEHCTSAALTLLWRDAIFNN